eukprot:2747487-Prymnesium_polylepis.1
MCGVAGGSLRARDRGGRHPALPALRRRAAALLRRALPLGPPSARARDEGPERSGGRTAARVGDR